MTDAFLQIFDNVWTLNLLLAACIALPSGLIQGYAGFGGGLFAVPLFAILFDPVTAFGMILILMLASQVHIFAAAFRKADWKEILPVTAPNIVTIALGILFLVSADPAFVRSGMGVFILLVTVFMMFGFRYTGQRRVLVGIATGSVAGGITGSFGVPAFPLSAIYFHNSSSAPEIVRANVLTALCCSLLVALVVLAQQGAYDGTLLLRAALVCPVFTLGIYAGQYLFRIAPSQWFTKVTYAVLILTALGLIFA